MTKADIVDTIATATGLTKVETEAVVDGFISTVIAALKEGHCTRSLLPGDPAPYHRPRMSIMASARVAGFFRNEPRTA